MMTSMKKYALVKCYPQKEGGMNVTLANCIASSFEMAVRTLQQDSPVKLNENGYAKRNEFTWVVCSVYDPIFA